MHNCVTVVLNQFFFKNDTHFCIFSHMPHPIACYAIMYVVLHMVFFFHVDYIQQF